jgi:hypothetical protein
LETRDAKHEPRTLTEQKAAWLIQASEVLGGPQAVQHMVQTALHPDPVERRWKNAAPPGRPGMSEPKPSGKYEP